MSDSIEQRLSLAFLERFWADREAGKDMELADYLALYPGHNELIAREYLGAVAELRGDAEPTMAAEDALGDENRLGPYRLLQELGRGGQGVVWLAEDIRLGRKVALKVLSGLGPGAEGHLARFKREAALASKLDHPGICGVHDAGIERGVPYIAMRYVRGKTLAERLATLCSMTTESLPSSFLSFDEGDEEALEASPEPQSSGSVTSIDRGELDHLITAFEKIATALHAAHEVGIVHRDIKPGNIMVSAADDQPVILDFGLARDDSEDAGPSLTQTGDLFGTPAYMSPEQVTGRWVKLDRRSDIYSLGATLYECLTMRRPFDAPTRESLYQAIMWKEPESARKLNRLIPGDLEVILQCAMDKDRDRRYQTAADLAEDLRRVRAGEPILARKISALGRAWRWSKRRPAAAALVMALVLGIPAISGLGVWWWTHREDVAKQEQARIDESVEGRLEIGFYEVFHGSDKAAVAAFNEALRLDESSAEATVGLALACLNLGDPGAALQAIERGEERVENPGVLARPKAVVLGKLGREAEVASVMATAPKIAGSLMWFLEGLSSMAKGNRLGETRPAGRAAFQRAENMMMRAVTASSRPRRAYLFQLAIARGRLDDVEAATALADVIEALWPDSSLAWFYVGFATASGDVERAMAAYREAIRLDPEDTIARHNLGAELLTQGHLDDALAVLREAIRRDPDLAGAHDLLGNALYRQGDFDAAVAAYREAVRLDPEVAITHTHLGNALEARGQLDDAAAAYQEAIRLDPAYALARLSLGNAYASQERFNEAAAAYREAIRLDPGDARAHYNLGTAFKAQGRLDEAVAAFREAIRRDPEHAKAHANLGGTLEAQGQLDGAVAAYREAVRLDPDFAPGHSNLGTALEAQGQLDAAVAAYREAIRLDPALAIAHDNLGNALEQQGHLEAAVAAYREALRVDPDRAESFFHLGIALDAMEQFDEAIAAYREAIRKEPLHAGAHCNLGLALLRDQDRATEGLTLLRRGHDLGLQRGEAWQYPSASWLQEAVAVRARQLRQEGDAEGVVALLEEYTAAYPDLERLSEMLEQARRLLERTRDRDG